MTQALGRIGDIGLGTCTCHRSPVQYVTTIVSGATNVNVNAEPAALVGSIGVSSCGHVTTALTGSGTVIANGAPVHRQGDMGQNCGPYTLVTGSPNVFNSR